MVKRLGFILIASIFLCMGISASENIADDNKELSPQKQEKLRQANIKKELASAKANLKSGNNLDKSVASMRKLLEDSLNHADSRIHIMLLDLVKKQYAQGNEKLYLKQQYDTANIYKLSQQMFLVANELDKVDEGERKSNRSELSLYIPNLYGGVVYFVNKQKWGDAESVADTYLSLYEWPLFKDSKASVDSVRLKHTAYMHLLSCYRQKKYQEALKYATLALAFESRREATLETIARINETTKNSEAYMHSLEQGVEEFPTNTYFFPRLVDLYCDNNEFEKALTTIDKIINIDSSNLVALTTRQTILLNMERYDECIEQGKTILELNDTIAEVNYNTGIAYWNKSLAIEKTTTNVKERTKLLTPIYKECLPYMEHYRQLAPEDKEHWKPVLYTIYLTLNMGKEFAEIEDE